MVLPVRLGSRKGDKLGRKAHHLRHEVLDRIAPPALRDHLLVTLRRSVGSRRSSSRMNGGSHSASFLTASPLAAASMARAALQQAEELRRMLEELGEQLGE